MRSKTPEFGTKRIKKWFAFFPVKILYDGIMEKRWLETVMVEQVFFKYFPFGSGWTNNRFIDEEK
jgi:hypothetical protein